MTNIDRRDILKAAAAGAGALASGAAQAAQPLKYGAAMPFSFDWLKSEAKRLAGQPYRAPAQPAPDIVSQLNYDEWGKIKFDMDSAVYAQGPQRFPITFFHLGKFFRKGIQVSVVEGGQAREIVYDPAYFDMPADSPARKIPKGAGFAGIRIQEAKGGELDWRKNDWVAFLGASYFRAIGALRQYGLSARGVALDTWQVGREEEFPDFTHFWIGPEEGDTVTLHALLEGPGLTGAYRFVMTRGKGVNMDIDCSLFLRKDYLRFGLAPLTSMYWFSETRKVEGADWRPEIHDSDGLAMWTGSGERLWRPLNNPPRVMASAFGDNNPKGFGLLQRDRNFDHYLDGVYYDRRPSVWIEPKGQWGKGAVQLVEIPTDDEIHDNIVAMWVPAEPTGPGKQVDLSYRIYWQADEPFPTDLARCVATRLGNGGIPGQPRPKGVRKFMVEFMGGPLTDLPKGVKPEAALWASRGQFSYVFTEAVPDDVPGHWRAQFDLTAEGADPVEMRCFLKIGDKIISESWLFQYHPF
ncbi:MAG: glucan biosynthesis protein D [Hyphomicrobiales bacterium]|nr:glucan biosynthesis protein D [Hyphomicrobiales bacterium]